ncbi:coiled-coil domain-containing protein [Nocardiopsis sp. NPDC006938]|uniref:coiled-coil domain-containing protein n=1 Tax=Nocardiopsis sp. NPDC006938 TaxID=3364337 RepID=UPI0036AD40E9
MTSTPRTAPRRGRTAAAIAASAVLVLVGLPGAAHADPDEDVDIDELNQRAEELEETYDGELLQYTEIKDRVEAAEAELDDLDERLEKSRGGVSAIAAARYKGDGFDPTLQIVFSSQPEDMFTDAATVDYLGQNQAEQISELIALRDEQAELTAELQDELSEASDLIDDLEEQREDVAKRIEEYEAEQVPDGPGDTGGSNPGNGTIPDSARGGGWEQTTPRMAAIRDEIIMQFGAPYPVGCWRPSNDDHGTGTACDFMMSANGAAPSAANQALGQQIADYGIANADRLGIKYIIWEQQIWQSTSRQWTWMNDRGDLTQNHYDHVHISSY